MAVETAETAETAGTARQAEASSNPGQQRQRQQQGQRGQQNSSDSRDSRASERHNKVYDSQVLQSGTEDSVSRQTVVACELLKTRHAPHGFTKQGKHNLY